MAAADRHTLNCTRLPSIALKNQHKPGARRFCIKGGNVLGYQQLVFWPVKVNLQLIRTYRFSKPPVFGTFWPRESGEHLKKEKKVDSPHQHIFYPISKFSQSGRASAAGGKTKTQLLVKRGFPVTGSISFYFPPSIHLQIILTVSRALILTRHPLPRVKSDEIVERPRFLRQLLQVRCPDVRLAFYRRVQCLRRILREGLRCGRR